MGWHASENRETYLKDFEARREHSCDKLIMGQKKGPWEPSGNAKRNENLYANEPRTLPAILTSARRWGSRAPPKKGGS